MTPSLRDTGMVNLWSLQYVSGLRDLSPSDNVSPSLPDAHPRTAYWLALWAIENGDGQTALTLMEPLAGEGDRYALQFMGWAYETLGDFSAAIQVWEQIGNSNALLRMAGTATQAGHLDDALAAYYAAWELDPHDSTGALVDFLWFSKEDIDAAEAVLWQTLSITPRSQHRWVWFDRLGRILAKQSRWHEAAEVYQQAVDENINDSVAYVALGWIYYHGGDGPEAAMDEFRQAIDIDSDRPNGYMAIAQILSREKRYAEALEIYRETTTRFPDNQLAYYEMAWVYYLDGQTQQAVTSIERALEFSHSLDDYGRVGQIFEAADETERAIAAFQRVLISRPNDKTALEALERLNNGQ